MAVIEIISIIIPLFCVVCGVIRKFKLIMVEGDKETEGEIEVYACKECGAIRHYNVN